MNGKPSSFSAALLVLFCLLPGPGFASAEADDLLTLYTVAAGRDPAIGKARSRLEGSTAERDVLVAQRLPRVEAHAGMSRIFNTSLNYGSEDIHGAYTGRNYGVSAQVPLLQVPAVWNLSASRAAVRGAAEALSSARQGLIVALAEAYFGLLKAQTDEVLYREEMNRLGKIYDQVSEFKASGTAPITAVYEARAKFGSATADSIKAMSIRKLAAQKLESIVGRPVAAIMDLGSYTPHGPEPADLEWWVDVMQKSHPGLVQARELLKQSELHRRAAEAGHLPTVYASGGYSVNRGSTFLPEVETRQWSFGLNLSLPIYAGGETSARIAKALALESEQGFIVREIRDQGIQLVKQAFLNLEYSVASIPSVLQKVESAAMLVDVVWDGRQVGTRTGIDLVNAEQALAVAQRDLAGALYDNALRDLQLKAAAGILTEDDLAEVNGLLVNPPGR